MRRLSIASSAALGFLLLLTSSAPAAWVSVGGNGGANVVLMDQTPQQITLQLTVGGFDRTDVVINGQSYSEINLPGEGRLLDAGLPELPTVSRSVIIPDDRRMSLRVVSTEYTDVTGIDAVPSKGNLLRTVDPATVPYTFGASYSTPGWYPSETASAGEAYILRDFRGMAVTFHPFQYDASTHTLRVATRMTVQLVDAGPGGENVFVRQSPNASLNSAFGEIYQHMFLNFNDGNFRYNMVPEVGSMLVIAYDDFAPAMQPFVDWKNQEGVPTRMVLKSQAGTTAAQIKAYIQSAYDASNSPKLAYVLLVGDIAQMPSPSSDGGMADPTYAKVVGTDYYPDIFVGRFSAENVSQVQTQVLRSINYEKDPLIAGGDWYPKGTGIGSEYGTGDDNEYDWQHIDNIRTQLLAYGYTLVDQIYPNHGANAGMVTAALNEGRTIINYCGHGSMTSWGTTGFSNSHVNQLQNDNKLPFIFSVACVNGQFDAGTCFAEAWMRATHNGNPSGAVATYMSSINQSWNPPMQAQDEANRLLTTDAVRTFGSYCYNGSCGMIESYGYGGASMYNTWHIFGDPSLRLRTAAPQTMTVNCEMYIAPDATTFTVDVPGTADALCALSYQGAFLGSVVADHSGHAVIPIVGPLPEGQAITLTVTGYNRVPSFQDIQVEVPALPSITFNPSSFEVIVPPNSMLIDTLWVTNQGEPGSTLDFTARFTSMIPGMWLAVVPMTGSVPNGETMALRLQFNTIGLQAGTTHEGQVLFTYNPNQTASVPVTMHVGDATGLGTRGGPVALDLRSAGPNPFQGGTALSWALPQSGSVRLAIYDPQGRMVRLLDHGPAAAGYHVSAWDGVDGSGHSAATGVYFVRLEADGKTRMARLLKVR